jgi:hypothetical protein
VPLGSMAKPKYSLFSSHSDGTIQTDGLTIQAGGFNNALNLEKPLIPKAAIHPKSIASYFCAFSRQD